MNYIDISSKVYVDKDDLICILDLDRTTVSKTTREFLRKNEKSKRIVSTAHDIPKSIVVTDNKVYLVQLSVVSLKGKL